MSTLDCLAPLVVTFASWHADTRMYEKMIDFVIKNRSMQFAQYAGTTMNNKKLSNQVCGINKKGVPSAVGFPHCAGSGERLFLSPKPYPHKCAEAGLYRNHDNY